MVRRSALAVLLFAGCTGDIDTGISTEGLSPAEQVAQDAWVKRALPALKLGTCDTCHAGQRPDAPPYLMGANDIDIRKTIVVFTPSVVSLGSPKTSPIILRGAHTGPALSASGISDVLYWIQYEQLAKGPGTPIETVPAVPAACVNGPTDMAGCLKTTIDLSANGSPGSTFTFFAQPLGPDLYLQAITVTAGASGLTMVHPYFKTKPAGATDAKADTNDTFYNVALSLAAGATATLGMSGKATMTGFSGADPLSIQFDALSTK